MNQSEFLMITCNLLKVRENHAYKVQFGFASHWLKNWGEIFKSITKRSSRNRIIPFESHLKTARREKLNDWLRKSNQY